MDPSALGRDQTKLSRACRDSGPGRYGRARAPQPPTLGDGDGGRQRCGETSSGPVRDAIVSNEADVASRNTEGYTPPLFPFLVGKPAGCLTNEAGKLSSRSCAMLTHADFGRWPAPSVACISTPFVPPIGGHGIKK
ncbi:hypothetical protein VTH06DRAFT_8500 [Thermothelomyces fergusii]